MASGLSSFFHRLFRLRGLIIRAIACWLIGLGLLYFDEENSFDLRLQIRSVNKPDPSITLVPLKGRFGFWTDTVKNLLVDPQKNYVVLMAPKFSDSRTFLRLFTQLNSDQKSRLLVVRGPTELQKESKKWLTYSLEPSADPADSIHRRFNFSSRTSGLGNSSLVGFFSKAPLRGTRAINFQAPPGGYRNLPLKELEQNLQISSIQKSIFILSSERFRPSSLFTPLGKMSVAEYAANLIDNSKNGKWIRRLPKVWYSMYLLFILLLSIYLLMRYPQQVSVVFLVWIATAATVGSFWVFDSFFLWLPIISVVVQIFLTYVVFISYQLVRKEKMNWRLEQETKTFYEIEQLKTNFVSLFSHDLKTPIAKIQAVLDRLFMQESQGGLDQNLKEDLTSIRKSSDELFQYIQKILQISRIESGKIKLHKESTDINEVLENVVANLKPLSEEKRLVIQRDLTPLFSVEVDTSLIQEVIQNILENAIRYSPISSEIKIRSQETDNEVQVEIHDSGPGISQEDQARIWDRFVRGSNNNAQYSGSGLGLYLCKYFIELHGGRIWLESVISKGTSVKFALPFDTEGNTQ